MPPHSVTCALLGLACALHGALAGLPDEPVEFVEFRVHAQGTVLDRTFVDLDGDGRLELVLAVSSAEHGGRRELHIHDIGPDGVLALEPRTVIPVMDDVIAWSCADVRPELGRELVFLTPKGAWSYSTRKSGYRGNIARLVDTPLFYDIPDPDSLPLWRYVLPAHDAESGDTLLLAEPGGYVLWAGPRGESYAEALRFSKLEEEVPYLTDTPTQVEAGRGGLEFNIGSSSEIFIDDEPFGLAALLRGEGDFRSPALVDVDGNGYLDLLSRRDGKLDVHLDLGAGIEPQPQRSEERPQYLKTPNTSLSQTLYDLDNDGDMDIVARISEDRDGLDARVIKILILINDGTHLYPGAPAQVLRFEGNEVRYLLSDIDHDGRVDLVITKYDMPSLMDLATGFELKRSTFLFLGRGQEIFEKQPVLRDQQIFGIENVDAAIVGRYLDFDLSGDGIADLVEVDLQGRIAVRRLLREDGWFSGEQWSLEQTPWRRFDARGSIANLEVEDVNGDGLGDMITHRGSTLVLLMSRRGGER